VSKSNPLHNSSLTYIYDQAIRHKIKTIHLHYFLYNTLLEINKTRLDKDTKSKTPLMYPNTNERHNIPNPTMFQN
jgi:hypothetical protein